MPKGRLPEGGSSKGKGRKRYHSDEDEDDGDDSGTHHLSTQTKRARAADRSSRQGIHTFDEGESSQRGTQASQASASQRPFSELSSGERKKMVFQMVRYFLFADRRKIPFKRATIIDHVPGLKEYSRSFSQILEDAVKQLRDIVGFDLQEISAPGSSKQWIVVNTLKTGPIDPFIDQPSDASNRGLLMAVLTVILMKDNSINDDELYIFLERFGIDRSRKHTVFGEIDKTLQQWVQQKYLSKSASDVQDDASKKAYSWQWGQRANEEIDRVSCLDLAAQMYGQPEEDWREEFKSLLARNGES